MIHHLDGTMVPYCDACASAKCSDGTDLTRLCPLHAAAPEMKAALTEAVALIEVLGLGAEYHRWLLAAREVLAKATEP